MKARWIWMAVGVLAFSCKKNSDPVTALETCDVEIKSGLLKNPYSLSTAPGIGKAKTHTYEKIVLKSVEDYNRLAQQGVQLSAVPFESADAAYVPERQGIFPVAYAIVPNGVDLTSYQHELLDALYMPDHSGKRVSGTASNTISGKVQFFNPISAANMPVAGVKVIVKDVTKLAYAYTDANGDFTIEDPALLSDTVQVLLEFNNDYYELRTLDVGNLQGIVFPNKFSLGYKRTCGLTNMQIEVGPEFRNSLLQYSMATLVSLNQYKKFAAENGLQMPTKKMVFWLGKEAPISTSYSAPMLNNIAITDQTQIQGLLTQLFGVPDGLAAVLYLLVKDKLPDIYAPYYTRNVNTVPKSYLETLYHEFTHASHYAKVGNDFWNTYIQHIFRNGGYGTGTEPDAGMIQLSEAWAEDLSYFCAYQLYGLPRYITETERITRDFIPYGIYNDVYDDASDTATISGNLRHFDEVSGVSFTQMYQLLTPDVRTPGQFRQALKTTFPVQAIPIDSLFSIYGF